MTDYWIAGIFGFACGLIPSTILLVKYVFQTFYNEVVEHDRHEKQLDEIESIVRNMKGEIDLMEYLIYEREKQNDEQGNL